MTVLSPPSSSSGGTSGLLATCGSLQTAGEFIHSLFIFGRAPVSSPRQMVDPAAAAPVLSAETLPGAER